MSEAQFNPTVSNPTKPLYANEFRERLQNNVSAVRLPHVPSAEERIKQIAQEIPILEAQIRRLEQESRLLGTPDGSALWNLRHGVQG